MKQVVTIFLTFVVGVGVGVAGKTFQYSQQSVNGDKIEYKVVASTGYWDVLVPEGGSGRSVSLGQEGMVRVSVLDDGPSLYVLTYKKGKALWEGRLIDIGNDGTIEVANISGKQCESR